MRHWETRRSGWGRALYQIRLGKWAGTCQATDFLQQPWSFNRKLLKGLKHEHYVVRFWLASTTETLEAEGISTRTFQRLLLETWCYFYKERAWEPFPPWPFPLLSESRDPYSVIHPSLGVGMKLLLLCSSQDNSPRWRRKIASEKKERCLDLKGIVRYILEGTHTQREKTQWWCLHRASQLVKALQSKQLRQPSG